MKQTWSASMTSDAASIEVTTDLMRRITMSLDLRETLQLVVQAVVDRLGFGAAVVNLIRPDDVCEVVAIAGPQEVIDALRGTRSPMTTWRRILERCDAWGELRFLDHRRAGDVPDLIPTYIPPDDRREIDKPWHPADMLFALLRAPDGALIGLLAVDMPANGRRPNRRQRRMLEQFAAHASLAIEQARVHTLVAESERLFRATVDRSPIAIALLTKADVVYRVNAAYERLLGYPAADLIGSAAAELAPPASWSPMSPELGPSEPYEVRFTRADGSQAWGRVHRTLLESDIEEIPETVLIQVEDVTQMREMQQQFVHDATHDHLTGLANRALVLRRLDESLVAARDDGRPVGLLFCDIDYFKDVNDRLGHAVGDRLLVEIARRLTRVVRAGDLVGRFGGDEFVVVARSVRTGIAAAALAGRVLRLVGEPVRVGDELIRPSLSIGGALSTVGDTADDLLAAADRALYVAKSAGRGRWHLA